MKMACKRIITIVVSIVLTFCLTISTTFAMTKYNDTKSTNLKRDIVKGNNGEFELEVGIEYIDYQALFHRIESVYCIPSMLSNNYKINFIEQTAYFEGAGITSEGLVDSNFSEEMTPMVISHPTDDVKYSNDTGFAIYAHKLGSTTATTVKVYYEDTRTFEKYVYEYTLPLYPY